MHVAMFVLIGGDIPEESFSTDRQILKDEPKARLLLRIFQFRSVDSETPNEVARKHSAVVLGLRHVRHRCSRIGLLAELIGISYWSPRIRGMPEILRHVWLSIRTDVHARRTHLADHWTFWRRRVRSRCGSTDRHRGRGGRRADDVDLFLALLVPQIYLKYEEVTFELRDINFLSGARVGDAQTNAWRRSYRPAIFVAETAHTRTLRLLTDLERELIVTL